VAILKLLLARHDVDINSPDGNGTTPLSLAVKCRKEEIVELLLARKYINVSLQDHNGRTFL